MKGKSAAMGVLLGLCGLAGLEARGESGLAELVSRGQLAAVKAALDAEGKTFGEKTKAWVMTLAELIAAERAGTNKEGDWASTRKPALLQRVIGDASGAAGEVDGELSLLAAGVLIRQVVEPELGLLEYWPPKPVTMARVGPGARAVSELLESSRAWWQKRADEAAGRITSPQGKEVQAYEYLAGRTRQASYTMHMAAYALALSMDPAEERRRAILQDAIEELGAQDTAESGVQPIVRLRMGRMHALLGEFDQAAELLGSVAGGKTSPVAEAVLQYQAMYFLADVMVLKGEAGRAGEQLRQLRNWKSREMAQRSAPEMAWTDVAELMLEYRILRLTGDEAGGRGVLAKLLEKQPGLAFLVFEDLFGGLRADDDLSRFSPAMLSTLVNLAEAERLKDKSQTKDQVLMKLGLKGTEKLLKAGGDNQQEQDKLKLIGALLKYELQDEASAAMDLLSFAKTYPTHRQARAALDTAGGIIAGMRQKDATDKVAGELYDAFLPVAVGAPFGRDDVRLEYARRLAGQGKWREAADQYARVPISDAGKVQARLGELVSLRHVLDEQATQPSGSETKALLQRAGEGMKAWGKASAEAGYLETGGQMVMGWLVMADVWRRHGKDLVAAEKAADEAQQALERISDGERGLGVEDRVKLQSRIMSERVSILMDGGRNAEAAEVLTKAMEKAGGSGGGGGAGDVGGDQSSDEAAAGVLLGRLSDDLTVALAEGKMAAAAAAAQRRAELAGLVKARMTGRTSAASSYRLDVFYAESVRLAGMLGEAGVKAAKIREARGLYDMLAGAGGQSRWRATLPGDSPMKGDMAAIDPQVTAGLALCMLEMGEVEAARGRLAALLAERRLGGPQVQHPKDEGRLVYNDLWWEATLGLYEANVKMSAQPGDLEPTRVALAKLLATYGETAGGTRHAQKLKQLRWQLGL